MGDFASHMPVTCTTGGLLEWTFSIPTEDSYFLVVPSDGLMDGSYGRNSKSVERPTSSGACLPQALGTCP